jgi:ribonuclease HII
VDYSNPFIEIGVDEAGRGPMFGRVYIGAVVLPKDHNKFDFSKMKDSKKFHSEKKIKEVAEYIKKNAIAWSVVYAEHDEIDKSNIRRATIDCMHKAINDVIIKLKTTSEKVYLLIDGNDFIPMMKLSNESYIQIPHLCIEGGDNKYAAIAAASILAKVSRDEYIHEMCKEHADLNIKYDLISNKGYGTKKHMDGIKEHGISKWHRKSFGICREFS